MKKMLIVIGIAVMLAACTSGGNREPEAKGGEKMAAFALEDLDGNVFDSSQLSGKVAIIDFWATWCPPCKKEIPHFIELYDEYADDGLVIVGISVDEDINALETFVPENGINYVMLKADKEGRVVNDFGGITGIPTTFLIDRDGNIAAKFIGYREKAVFEEALKELL